MNNYVKHAIREFETAGWLKDGKYEEDEMQELMCKQIIELLEIWGKHGHSGTSAPYAMNLFKRLGLFEIVTPLTGKESEWEHTADNCYQNKRLSSVFKNGEKGQAYYLNAIIWHGEDEYDSFTGSVEEISSRQFIKSFPFTPKIFYIDVVRVRYNKSIHKEKDSISCGKNGIFVYSIKNRKQLDDVFNYYDVKMKGENNKIISILDKLE